LSVLFLNTSCKRTLELSNEDGISFIVRLPSIAIAQFEARCVTEGIFLDQVKIQSPSSIYITEEFNHQRYARDEVFFVGNNEAEDGLWLITFIGTSAITNQEFHQIVPYEMVIAVDDNDE
jgi:hypothetical protein